MIIVLAIASVDVERPFGVVIFQIRLNRAFIPAHHIFIGSAQHVDMRGHMHQMTGIGHQCAQYIRRLHRLFGIGRHFHQVHIEVQNTGVFHPTGQGHLRFQHGLGLNRFGIRGDGARLNIPHLPRREVHQRINKGSGDIGVRRMSTVYGAHRIGKGAVPWGHILDRVSLGVACAQCMDQRRLGGGGVIDLGERGLGGVIGICQRFGLTLAVV